MNGLEITKEIFDKTDTVSLSEDEKALVIIDQTCLPNAWGLLHLTTAQEIYDAIYLLQVRGAPAIGVAAAYGLYVLARQIAEPDTDAFFAELHRQKEYLNSARPTAVNLSWALERMEQCALAYRDMEREVLLNALKNEAIKIQQEDIAICKSIGEHGLKLIEEIQAQKKAAGKKEPVGLLTHCNAGRLATSRYGTATAPMYLAKENGIDIKVYADETRPLLQGARLTATELYLSGIDVTLLCDNMASSAMQKGMIDAVFVGCDRVAANGDIANKIGTSGVAILAAHYHIPFYVCAPSSTIDGTTKTGADIVIEERDQEEVKSMWYEKPMALHGVKAYNPAFDVTKSALISAIITEHGVCRYPYAF